MPRPTTIAIYSVVFGVALLTGLLVATLLRPKSLPAASFVTPTAEVESLAASSQFIAAAPPATELSTATPVLPTANATLAPTSTPQPSPTATEFLMPTITPSITPTKIPPSPTAAPKPLAFAARIVDRPTDAAVACGASFESHIWGVIKDRGGRGIYRAVVEISSADGKHHYRTMSNDQGGFEAPGLGCTTWVVRLVGVPRAPAGVQAPILRLNLNGGRYSGAGIEFRQR